MPALIQREAATDLRCDVFAGLHGCDGLLRVPFPGRGNEYRIHIFVGNQPMIVMWAVAIYGGFFLPFGFHYFQTSCHHAGVRVGDGHHFYVVAQERRFHMIASAQADADETEVDLAFGFAARQNSRRGGCWMVRRFSG